MSSFPAWFYGPNGQEQIFQNAAEIPAGWHDHPSKVITPPRTGSAPVPPLVDKIPPAQRGAAPIVAKNNAPAEKTGGKPTNASDQSNTTDAYGHAWDAKLHATTQSKTKDGLWRMRVGVKRPAPAAGFPKPEQPLDL